MDYTPTTEEVRQLYVDATRELLARDMYLDEIQAEFDRWLAEVKAEQDKATTDRIIALLNNNHTYNGDCVGCEAIALIKGENNE